MSNRLNWRKSLIFAGLGVLSSIVAINIVILIAIGLQDWDLSLFATLYSQMWILFLSIIVVVFIAVLFMARFPLHTLVYSLSLATFILIIASSKDTGVISYSIRHFIESNFYLEYLTFSLTIFALLVGFVALHLSRKTKQD